MIGQMLGNRYELIEKIGGGGMAHVYKAKCHLLNRFVAIKILRPEFYNDEEFIRRFMVEAQSAASLSHPNIVSVYDVGQEEELRYIVMEYVQGETLKDMLVRQGPLPWKSAVNIAIQICSAIEHAHKHKIIHRDIKPHNILVSEEGIAKVTDFGIARAVTSSTITMAGGTIGSVHYFSPEQARGGFIDEKSDLYALGVTLYELTTGRVPFDGETPVAVALKHIQMEPSSPKTIREDLPDGICDIIMKAMRKDTTQRYQTGGQMLDDLYKVMKHPEGGFVDWGTDTERSSTQRGFVLRQDNVMPESREEDELKETKRAKREKTAIVLGITLSLVIIGVIVFSLMQLLFPSGKTADSTKFEIRNYVGMTIKDAKDELSKGKIQVIVKEQFDETTEKNIVLAQSIERGVKVDESSSIELKVSKGPALTKMPNLTKIDARQAETRLVEQNLVVRVEEVYDDQIAAGLVVKTDPVADQEVAKSGIVTIYKSKGKELKDVEVPDLTGKTADEAKKMLADLKLSVGKIYPENPVGGVVDKIIKQDPAAKTKLKEGSVVNITLEETKPVAKRTTVQEKITLDTAQTYGNTVKIYIEILPSDTNKSEVLMNEEKPKTAFPFTINVPVPEKGTTKVSVYLDNKQVLQKLEDLTGR